MRIVKTEVIEETRTTSITPKFPHISRTEKTGKILNKETNVFVDSYEQRESLENYLKEHKFKMSNGAFGEQKDFQVGYTNLNGENSLYVKLQFQNQKRYERLIKTVLDWCKR
jgi:hypothetical protein